MTNPNNAIGTNAAYSGRTSANAFNDVLSVLSRGIVSGWVCSPDTGMSVVLGGDGTTRDVAIAEDNIGNRTTINNISGTPVSVTIGTAPIANSRIDLIVAYVDNPPEGTSTITDNYEACGLIVVQGTASASPTAPNDSDIRTAITTDGGSGVTAYYVVLAEIAVASGTTVIDESLITQGGNAGVANANIQNETIKASKFAPYAINIAILTADNLTPSADTPEAWVLLLGGDGYYVTQYDTAGKFTNQPDQYGQLETFVSGTHVYQRFSQDMSIIWHRGADSSDWNIYSSGEFRLVFDDRTARIGKGPVIPTGTDLNTTTYIIPRDYTGTSGTYTNCPTTAGFSLTVQNIGRQLDLNATSKNASVIRILTSRDGNIWTQYVHSNSTPTWTFDDWKLMTNSYSTTEQAVGTWIDGKTIYRQVVQGSYNVSTSGEEKYIELLGSGIVTGVIVAVGGYDDGGSYEMQLIPNADESGNYQKVYRQNNTGKIILYTKPYKAGAHTYSIWIEYTKN